MPNQSESTKKILEHLARYGVRDKDAIAALGKPAGKKQTQPTGKKRNRRTLDLHGKTSDIALSILRQVIDECAERGTDELLVIHGYGLHSAPGEGGVLKTMVRQYLEGNNDPRLRSYASAAPKDGGDGATVVRLK
jgi:DNA-nicking Smr family endonuclease